MLDVSKDEAFFLYGMYVYPEEMRSLHLEQGTVQRV